MELLRGWTTCQRIPERRSVGPSLSRAGDYPLFCTMAQKKPPTASLISYLHSKHSILGHHLPNVSSSTRFSKDYIQGTDGFGPFRSPILEGPNEKSRDRTEKRISSHIFCNVNGIHSKVKNVRKY